MMITNNVKDHMIPLQIARQLKDAGLTWYPQTNDTFMIPDRDLDDKTFVLTNMAIRVERLQGYPTIAFQGAYEWALDYIWLSEVIWVPTETQLREAIEQRLRSGEGPRLRLTSTAGGYVCEISHHGAYQTFSGDSAGLAYAQTLLYLLKHA
jgi:hypothetical protein